MRWFHAILQVASCMTPAKSAQRLLLGTGLGLLLASGFGLISGVISLQSPSAGFLVPLFGFIFLVLAQLTAKGEGPLSELFPNENSSSMAKRVESELTQEKKDADVGSAWAKLEHTMLSRELEEE